MSPPAFALSPNDARPSRPTPGIALTAIYAPNGWVGKLLAAHDIKVAYAVPGIVLALVFIGLPFTVRTLQPVLETLGREPEEAAASAISRPLVMAISAMSMPAMASRSAASVTDTTGAASREAPIVFCARAISSAPVTTRRTFFTRSHFAASAAFFQSPGIAGNCSRCTDCLCG